MDLDDDPLADLKTEGTVSSDQGKVDSHDDSSTAMKVPPHEGKRDAERDVLSGLEIEGPVSSAEACEGKVDLENESSTVTEEKQVTPDDKEVDLDDDPLADLESEGTVSSNEGKVDSDDDSLPDLESEGTVSSKEGKVDSDDDSSTATEKSQVRSANVMLDFDDDTLAEPVEVTFPEFDDETLRAKASGYLTDGNKELRKGEVDKAIQLYTEGLQVNCGDMPLNAKIYSNRATAHFSLGNYQETLDDATVAVQLQPTLIKAIEKGAKACVKLELNEEAIIWCQKGLEIDKNNKILLDVWTMCAGEPNASHEIEQWKMEGNLHIDSANCQDIQKELFTNQSFPNDDPKIVRYKQDLKIAKEVGDKAGEQRCYCIIGIAYDYLGNFKKAIEYHKRDLKISKEIGDKVGEGTSYCNIGNAFQCLGDFNRAIECHKRHLEIAKEVGDKAVEGKSYGNLGNDYHRLGDFKKAIDYHKRDLEIAQEVGDKSVEGKSYGNLGNDYHSLGDFKKAIEYHKRDLEIAKEVGDKAGEGECYGNLGNDYHGLGDFKKAIEYHQRRLKITEENENKAGEGRSYGSLGIAYHSLGDIKKAIEYFEHNLKIAKEVGDKHEVAASSCNLGMAFESQGSYRSAFECYHSSVTMFNNIRTGLQHKDEWKITYRDLNNVAYNRLWRLRLKQGEVPEALHAAEEGRAQALGDLMDSKYANGEAYNRPHTPVKSSYHPLSCVVSNTVFIAVDKEEIIFWVIQSNKDVELRRKEMSDYVSQENVSTFITTLYHNALKEIGVHDDVKCENRSLDEPCDEALRSERSPCNGSHAVHSRTNLRKFYDIIIAPVADLLHGNEVIFVPDGPLCLVPYAALVNSKSKYLSESLRIRLIPSLTTLKLVTDCPADFHNKTGALLVGDPCLEGVQYNGHTFDPLPYARKEVEMIGKILGTDPLIGEKATKDEVLKRMSSVALVHIAAHGRMETGEIALAPSHTRETRQPEEKDFMLTMRDVLGANLRARLVVLSCCHSARGEIKAEGVVGIARAFLGTGARSVLVTLWGIDDVATLEFMKHFYGELFKGKKASEALTRAMQFMRESEKFAEVKYWAPFVLIGDDVTLELNRG